MVVLLVEQIKKLATLVLSCLQSRIYNFAVKFTLQCWRRVAFKFFVSLFVVNKCVHFVKIVSFVHNNSHTSFVGW